jgi:Ca2+-binding EF-hand superfamily protein
MDKDKDGKVKKAEYLRKYAWILNYSEKQKKEEDPEARSNRMFMTHEFKLEQKKFKFADVDKDGALSEDEFFEITHPERSPRKGAYELVEATHFVTKHDLDKDGVLNLVELKKAFPDDKVRM